MAQLQLSADFARLLHSAVLPSLPPSLLCLWRWGIFKKRTTTRSWIWGPRTWRCWREKKEKKKRWRNRRRTATTKKEKDYEYFQWGGEEIRKLNKNNCHCGMRPLPCCGSGRRRARCPSGRSLSLKKAHPPQTLLLLLHLLTKTNDDMTKKKKKNIIR